jgi:hypothetical protein
MDPKNLVQYIIGPSNYTSAEVFNNNLRPDQVYIAIEEISNKSAVVLRDAPTTQPMPKTTRARKSVDESLDQSIKENAAIWSELAKH